MSRQRIGVLGGAFDPPHRAHIALAQVALEQLQLDALRIIPTGQAWHKPRPLSAAAHRLAMAQLAFASLGPVQVDARETERSGPSYSVDTLRELQAEFPDADLFLILGQDQAQALPTWRQADEVCKLATICVAERPIPMRPEAQFSLKFREIPGMLHLKLPAQDVSATAIRAALASGLDIASLVTEPVARYIAHHHLYQTA